MTNHVDVTVESTAGTIWQMPVPAVVTITNREAEPIHVLLPYPYPGGLTFGRAAEGLVQTKPAGGDLIERSAPIEIRPGETWRRRYFLNRYYLFRQPGSAQFSFELHMAVTYGISPPITRYEGFAGAFQVSIAAGTDVQRRAGIAEYGTALTDPDPERRAEAAEALGFLDTPDVIPYLLVMLQTADLRTLAVQALGRHPSPETEQAIVAALQDRESSVVSAALAEIDRLRIEPPRTNVRNLLGSSNPGIVYAALGWLSSHPSREDLPFVTALHNDRNEALRARARAYEQQLTGH